MPEPWPGDPDSRCETVTQPIPAFDPIVAALAQLVRDRWANEHPDSQGRVAAGPVLSNMANMTVPPNVDDSPA
jgi:hypothetical protein